MSESRSAHPARDTHIAPGGSGPRSVTRAVIILFSMSLMPISAGAPGVFEDRYDVLTPQALVFDPLFTASPPCSAANVACFPLDGTKMRAYVEIEDDLDPRPVAAWVAFLKAEDETAWNYLVCGPADLPLKEGNALAKVWVPRSSGWVDADNCDSSVGPLGDIVATPTRGVIRMTLTTAP